MSERKQQQHMHPTFALIYSAYTKVSVDPATKRVTTFQTVLLKLYLFTCGTVCTTCIFPTMRQVQPNIVRDTTS